MINDQQAQTPVVYHQVSRTEVKQKIISGYLLLKQYTKTLIIACVLGALLGFLYGKFSKPQYTATSTFVLEESQGGGALGAYSGIASQLGISLGGEMGSGGLFHGDNIIELYKSRSMLQKTLLTPVNINGHHQLLINRFIDAEGLRTKWDDKPKLHNLTFDNIHNNKHTFLQDSIIGEVVKLLNKKYLSVFKPDKKLTIINVTLTYSDQLFAKYFNQNLVENVNQFYVVTKTKKSSKNVNILRFKLDSVRKLLNSSISGAAAAVDASPNANPFIQSLKVPSQRRQVDVQTNGALYTEIVKNLTLSEITMRQDAPLIQVIDEPILPLEKKKTGIIVGTAVGIFLAFFVTAGFLIMRKLIWE